MAATHISVTATATFSMEHAQIVLGQIAPEFIWDDATEAERITKFETVLHDQLVSTATNPLAQYTRQQIRATEREQVQAIRTLADENITASAEGVTVEGGE